MLLSREIIAHMKRDKYKAPIKTIARICRPIEIHLKKDEGKRSKTLYGKKAGSKKYETLLFN